VAETVYDAREIAERLGAVRERIAGGCRKSGRNPAEVRIVAVTKTHPIEAIVAAWHAGLREFGENRIQEALPKFGLIASALPQAREEGLRLHMIGHLQRNKAKAAVETFDLIHSVDSVNLADELDKYAGRAGKQVAVLVQVNVSGEASKSGIAPEDTAALVQHILGECANLRVEGYMTIAPLVDDPEAARPCFRLLRELRDELGSIFAAHERYTGRELSMGMTNDFEVAVEEGATMVRIGTALFGAR
jgi:pyridoxal phosphate enzyme (YggS family)